MPITMNILRVKTVSLTTDLHSHCLPGMDDGAADIATSLAMLATAKEQGITTIAATPHFYPGQESVAAFLERRQESLAALSAQLPADAPRLLCGAEVLLWEGISRLNLRELCLNGTELLLVEFPFRPAPHWLSEELENIVYGQGITPIFAHVDRYMPWYSREQMACLAGIGQAILQLNGEAFLDRRHFAALRRWLPKGHALVMGSDMHNMERRSPNLGEACRVMNGHRVGREWLQNAEQTTARWLP